MVGDDPQPHVVGAALRRDVAGHCSVALARHLGRPVEHRPDLVDLVEVVDALQDAGDPLQAHAGVDVLLRQGSDDVEVGLAPDRAELELGEDEVPDLQEAVLVDRRPALRAVLRAAVVEDLAAGTAGAGNAHVPVVVEPVAPDEPLLRDVGQLEPERLGLVVVLVDGGPELLRVESVAAALDRPGQQLPRIRDGVVLEVVAEREVAVHLEEGAVPAGLPDLVEVRGADALLDGRRARPRRGLLAAEVGHEGNHPGHDEQQVRVVEGQRRAGHDGVPLLLEERQPTTRDLGGFHGHRP